MNQQVETLLYKAGIRYGEDGKITTTADELETLTMLIVSECVHAVVNTSDRYRREYFAGKIKEHFGVEE